MYIVQVLQGVSISASSISSFLLNRNASLISGGSKAGVQDGSRQNNLSELANILRQHGQRQRYKINLYIELSFSSISVLQ